MVFQHERERIFALDENGKLIAEVTFPLSGSTATINHTFVDDSLRGQGVANLLLTEAVAQIRTGSLKVVPTCSYAVKWFAEHPEHADLLV